MSSITYDDLVNVQNKLDRTLYGVEIIESVFLERERPKIQLSPGFKWCTDKFRAKQNKWLADTFGHTLNFLEMQHPLTGRQCFVTHPANVAILKRYFNRDTF